MALYASCATPKEQYDRKIRNKQFEIFIAASFKEACEAGGTGKTRIYFLYACIQSASRRAGVQPCSEAVSEGLIADLALLDRMDSCWMNELERGINFLQLKV
jgi:hypothetical protein